MPRNSADAIDFSVRSGRWMLRAGIAIDALDALTPSKLTDQIRVAHLASIDARSESVRIGDTTAVVVDETQARWISALCLVRSDFYAESWALHVLHAYYALRLVGCGLPNEARAFGDRLRPEARRLDPDTGFDVSDLHASVARIEHFILGHELGHVAYRGGGDFIEPLVGRVRDCADDLTRLLRVTFTGDRSLLTASEQDPRYEDIVQSVTDYLNRFIFHEFPEDVRAIERELEVRMQFIKLQARRHRYDVFARIFETVDFIEEAFCDLYALEFQLLDAGTSATRAAEITMHAWQCLHAMFALTALDSLARDRQVAARLCNEVRSILQDVDATSLSDAEVQALSQRVEDIEATRNSDRALLFYQLAMLKAIYRRVVFVNYVSRHPLLGRPELIAALKDEGEKLEQKFLGACATLRFNGIRLAAEHGAGFCDTLDPPGRADVDGLWDDFVVRVPGMDPRAAPAPSSGAASSAASAFQPRRCCDFCGGDVLTKRLIVTSGRASICGDCALVAESSFAAMPKGQPRRPEVGLSFLGLPPAVHARRAQPAVPHCAFCEIEPAAGEPLVQSADGGAICVVCADAAARIVRMRSTGPGHAYAAVADERVAEMEKLADEAESPEVRESMRALADSIRAANGRERALNLPGREIWRLFTEPTLALKIP